MSRLVVLVGLMIAFALTLPDSTEAASFSEIEKLSASDAGGGDRFGTSVAVSGDTAVVAGGSDAGAAYVFRRDEGGPDNWGEVTKLTASDAQDDGFGDSVGHWLGRSGQRD